MANDQTYSRDKPGTRLDLTGGMNTVVSPDLIPPGQGYPYLQNVRRLLQGRVVGRPLLGPPVLPANVNPPVSMIRINDPYLPAGWALIIGSVTGILYVWDNGSVTVLAPAIGLSGAPLSFVIFRPNASPQPWCYVSDPAMAAVIFGYPSTIYGNPTSGMVKVRSDGTVYKTGIAEPQVPPSVSTGGTTTGPNWVMYRYTYRSSFTGAVSNPSPESQPQIVPQVAASGTVNGVSASVKFNPNQWDANGIPGAIYLETQSGVAPGILTDYVVATNLPLPTVPDNVTIQGVSVTLVWAGDNDGTGSLSNVALYYDGAIIGNPKSPAVQNTKKNSSTNSPADGEPITQGGNIDTWGATLSPATVNDPTFGFGVQITTQLSGSTVRAFLYTFEITVYYVLPNTGVTGTASPDPQVDKIDFYRMGPSLDSFTYVGTVPNGTSVYNDTLSDLDIAANPLLEFDNFEPFPSIDLPHKGTVNVTGTVAAVTGGAGSGMTPGTYPLAFSGGGGSGASGSIIVATATAYTISMSTPGGGYTSAPSVSAATGGTPPALTAILGSMVTQASGDLFNVRWLPGTVILIGGKTPITSSVAYTLYNRPVSTTLLTAVTLTIDPTTGLPGIGYPPAGSGLSYEVSEPSLAAQASPVIWGPTPDNAGAFYFGLDPLNPGDLLWSKGNNFDSAPDTNRMYVTSPSETLMNGTITSELSTVFSTERFWLIYPNFGDAIATVTGTQGQQWTLIQSAATRGLYMRHAICALGSMIAYRAKDCIAVSMGGGAEESITDSIYNLFPHGGSIPQPVSIAGDILTGITVYPPDDNHSDAQTITITPGYIFYNYQDTRGVSSTLVYDIVSKGWIVDLYNPNVNCHLWSAGPVNQLLVGCRDGSVHALQNTGTETELSSAVIVTRPENGGDARALKRVGDVFVKGQIGPGVSPPGPAEIQIQLWQTQVTQQIVDFNSVIVGTGAIQPYIIDIAGGGTGSGGGSGYNIGVDVDDIAAIFFWPLTTQVMLELWQPDWYDLPEIIQDRPTEWMDCGVPGNKLIRGMIIQMDTFNVAKALVVQCSDRPAVTPDQASVTANGQTLMPFTFTPFVTHMVRLLSLDAVPWRFYGMGQWIVDPWPDYTPLDSAWTNLGVDGAKYIRQLVLHMDTNGAPATFIVSTSDGDNITFTATTPAAVKTAVAFPFLPPIVAHEVQVQCKSNAGLWPEEAQWFFDNYPEITMAYTPIMELSSPDNKFVQGIKLVGDSNNLPVQFQILFDGKQIGPMLEPRSFNGKQTQVYSFNPPFNAHDVQLVPQQNCRIWMPGMGAGVEDVSKWDFQPIPDAATSWTTEASSFGLLGYIHAYQVNLTYYATAPVTFTMTTDEGIITLNFPAGGTATLPAKILQKFPRNKWKVAAISVTSTAPVQIYKDWSELWLKSWGSTGEYIKQLPFGGPASPAAEI